MDRTEIIRSFENTRTLEDVRFLLTRIVVESVGFYITDGEETPEVELTADQLKVKRMVNKCGYKVRIFTTPDDQRDNQISPPTAADLPAPPSNLQK